MFELVNGYKTMLDSNKVDQTAIVFNTVTSCFDVSLENELGLLFALFTLKEVFEGSLTRLKLFQLCLICKSLFLATYLLLHNSLSSL